VQLIIHKCCSFPLYLGLYLCELNLNATLFIISLFLLSLPVALNMAVVCCCQVPAFCTTEDEEGEMMTAGLLGR